jgi:hypothetical protein
MTKKEVLTLENKAFDANVGEHIGFELGAKMIKDYYDTYKEAGAQFVGRNILQQILAQPSCMGINIYKALNEKGEKTYVLVGVDEKGENIYEYQVINTQGSLSKAEGIVADRSGNAGWWTEENL